MVKSSCEHPSPHSSVNLFLRHSFIPALGPSLDVSHHHHHPGDSYSYASSQSDALFHDRSVCLSLLRSLSLIFHFFASNLSHAHLLHHHSAFAAERISLSFHSSLWKPHISLDLSSLSITPFILPPLIWGRHQAGRASLEEKEMQVRVRNQRKRRNRISTLTNCSLSLSLSLGLPAISLWHVIVTPSHTHQTNMHTHAHLHEPHCSSRANDDIFYHDDRKPSLGKRDRSSYWEMAE